VSLACSVLLEALHIHSEFIFFKYFIHFPGFFELLFIIALLIVVT